MTNTVDLLKKLISIPSYVDDTTNERNVSDFIFAELSKNKQLSITTQLVESGRQNIIAIDGKDPEIILIGHMDTVQPKIQERNPLIPYEENGKLFGLGSVDMKSGLAMMLDVATNQSRKGLGYIFTVDEEYSFKGARKLVEILDLKPKLIINVESTNLKIINGCRGVSAIEATIVGKAAHSGRKYLGVNAIEKSVELIQKFEILCQSFDPEGVQTSTNLCFLNGGLGSADGEVKSVDNIVPNYAKIHFSIRIGNRKITEDFIREQLISIGKSLDVEVKDIKIKFIFSSFLTPKENLKRFEGIMVQNGLKPEYSDINKQGFYEVQIIQSALNCDCIAFGPGPNEMSHSKDEYVDLSQLDLAQRVIEKYLNEMLPINN